MDFSSKQRSFYFTKSSRGPNPTRGPYVWHPWFTSLLVDCFREVHLIVLWTSYSSSLRTSLHEKRETCERKVRTSVAYAENFHWAGLVQGHMVVNCVWCSLFVTSQFDVICMFPNQRFGEVSWHNNAYFSTSTPLISCSIALNINYKRSKLGYRRKINSTLRHSSS